MEWFQGEIADAIKTYKEKHNAVLAVFLHDDTESSKNFEAIIEGSSGSMQDKDKFVAIKIASDTPGYHQFVQIYQLVPLPSLFFINSSGSPIEVATSLVTNSKELDQMIVKVCNNTVKPVTPIAVVGSSQSEDVTNEEEIRIEKLKAERIKRAQELVEKNRKDKIQEEAKREREREIERRQAGKNVQSLKDLKADLEMKQLKEDRIKEKLMEKEAREKVLLQICQDREERAKRFATPAANSPVSAPLPKPSQPIPTSSDSVRIQFKMDNGSTQSHTFKCSDSFVQVYTYAKNSVIPDPNINFSIVMTFPRTEFANDDPSTLLQLGLYPSASLLIISKSKFNSGNVMPSQPIGMLSAIMMNLYGQLTAAFAYVKSLIFNRNVSNDDAGKRKRDEEILSDNDAAKRRNLRSPPSASGSRKANKRVTNNSNIHRLHDNESDSDDLNTYNGNSTEQL